MVTCGRLPRRLSLADPLPPSGPNGPRATSAKRLATWPIGPSPRPKRKGTRLPMLWPRLEPDPEDRRCATSWNSCTFAI
eukprot:7212769-Alexandrium_andersonii.AAC.1